MKGHNWGLCMKCDKVHVHPFLNKHQTEVTKKKISKSKMGHETSEATREKMSKSMIGKLVNEKNPTWKGDDVKYVALHQWIGDRKPKPLFCEICGKKRKLELANISGEYKRDVNDFLWVCHKHNCNMHIPIHSRFKK